MTSLYAQQFEDGSLTQTIVHEDGHRQVFWHVRMADGRIELLEWWIAPGNPTGITPPTTLDEARAIVKQLPWVAEAA